MLFSVITVTRNNLSGLKRTHESLRAQTCPDYEWIVIDGASGDGTFEYLKTTKAVWRSEPDRGIYDAMNKGMERASGDYLIFMNAGDSFSSADVLERLATHTGTDFIYGDTIEGEFYKRARSHGKAAYGMFTHHQSMIYRRNLIGDLRYDLTYKIAADYKFTLEFLRRAQTISCVPFSICIFDPGGISQKNVRQGRDEQFRIRSELGFCPLWKNISVYTAQIMAMLIRRSLPNFYWKVRAFWGG